MKTVEIVNTAYAEENDNDNDDEDEVLLGNGVAERPISMESTKQESARLEAFSRQGVFFIIFGTLLYGVLGTVSKLSFLGEKKPPYEPASVLILSEVFKFMVSGLLLINEQGVNKCLTTIRAQTLKQWLMFAVPAMIYSATNGLDFYVVRYMDPGSLQVLLQFKILTTALLWWYWFRKPISKQQWIALSLLVVGSICVSWPSPAPSIPENATDAEIAEIQQKQMHVELPGLIYVLIQVSLSALAGVYTEAMYKQYGSDRSIHLENLSMYAWGVVCNALQYKAKGKEFNSLMEGFNMYSWVCVGVFMCMGLVLGQVMKRFNNIVKLFMNGASIVVAGVLTFVCFGIAWTSAYLMGLLLVIGAVYLYRTEKVYCE